MYDKSQIMTRAWQLFRKGGLPFGECLHRAWQSAKSRGENAARIAQAQQLAGIAERCLTYTGWRDEGRRVKHGAKALFQVTLIHASKGPGAVYVASFFSESQTEPADAMTA